MMSIFVTYVGFVCRSTESIYPSFRVIDHGEQNRMSVQSMAIVFGPTLLRPQEESNITMHMVFQNQIVELILNEFIELFQTKWNYKMLGKIMQPSAHLLSFPSSFQRNEQGYWLFSVHWLDTDCPIQYFFFIRTNQNVSANKCPVKHQEDLHLETTLFLNAICVFGTAKFKRTKSRRDHQPIWSNRSYKERQILICHGFMFEMRPLWSSQ